jgi:hypothetical protein
VVMVVSAFLIAACLENLSVTMIVFLIGTYIWQRYRKQIWPFWAKMTTIAYLLGTVLLLTAPGNFVRAEFIFKENLSSHYPLFVKIPLLSEMIYDHFATGTVAIPFVTEKVTIPLLLLSLLAFVTLLVFKQIKHRQICLIFLFLALIAAFAMIGVPGLSFINRVTFPSDVFFTIAMLSILCQWAKLPYVKYLYVITALVGIGFVIPKMWGDYQEIKFIHQQYQARMHLIHFFQKKHAPVAIIQPMFSMDGQRSTYITGLLYRPTLLVVDAYYSLEKKTIDPAVVRYFGFKHMVIHPFVEIWSALLPYVNSTHTQAGSNFSVFSKDNALFYVSTRGSCADIKNDFPFFIHITPQNTKDLVKNSKGLTYNPLAFTWDAYHTVTIIDDKAQVKKDVCVLETKLPHYPIRSIETGQRQGEKILWSNTVTKIRGTN